MIHFSVFTVLSLFIGALGLMSLKGFLSKYTSIQNHQAFKKFKAMVRLQMYMALVQLPFLVGALVSGVYGVFVSDKINFIVFLLMQGSIFFFGKFMASIEEKTRSLELLDESIKDEYENICETWIKKALPNF